MVKSLLLIVICTFVLSVQTSAQRADVRDSICCDSLVKILTGKNWRSDDSIFVKDIRSEGNTLHVKFNSLASTVLLTEAKLDAMTQMMQSRYNNPLLNVRFSAGNISLKKLLHTNARQPRDKAVPVVCRAEQGALSGRNLALWNSHGKYYEQSLSRWEWQRARLFTTVEDLLTTSFVLPFLTPMLENAGANVFLPRERDWQRNVVVVDNESEDFHSNGLKVVSTTTGYKYLPVVRKSDNPFSLGTAVSFLMSEGDSLVYSGTVPVSGNYGVHVCYNASAESSSKVTYTVVTPRNRQSYTVNQQCGGSMWLYLGTLSLYAGDTWRIVVSGSGQVSADAVRLGGGMGHVERCGTTSNVPCYMEGARYYLQANGFDASVYSPSDGKNDYTDDVNARGEWVNALIKEKNINVDAVIALHTDAGIAQCDSVVGTLTIVSTVNKEPYHNGRNRWTSHALAYSVEQSIVRDLRTLWNPHWSERGIWDKRYSEARRANVPSVLIELLSHQNLNDMRYALHPQFRHDACRAIYKGILRYLEGDSAVIQPLAVSDFGICQMAEDTLLLSWRPTVDPLESSARPDGYHLYVDGELLLSTSDTAVTIHQPADGILREYSVRAFNSGGVSMVSQVMGARLRRGAQRAIVVDGNVRVAAPDIVKTDQYAGVLRNSDPGVPWGKELALCGEQYDYNPDSPWLDDDAPGWGASHADMEQIDIIGNRTLRASSKIDTLYDKGFSTVSVSKGFFEQTSLPADVMQLYISLGKERTTWHGCSQPRYSIYTPSFMTSVDSAAMRQIDITIAGDYVGSELSSEEVAKWASQTLGIKPLSHKASKRAGHSSVDAILPACNDAVTLERYPDTQAPAAVRYKNITTYGYED